MEKNLTVFIFLNNFERGKQLFGKIYEVIVPSKLLFHHMPQYKVCRITRATHVT